MDQELVAYLDRMSQQIEGLRGEMTQQIGGLHGEMTQQINGLRGEMVQKMDEFREEVREENRHTRVVMEGLRSDVQLMAEAVLDTRQLFGRHKSDMEERLEEIKLLIPLPYRNLNTRVTLLEEWVNRQGRDPIEVLREKFEKRQA